MLKQMLLTSFYALVIGLINRLSNFILAPATFASDGYDEEKGRDGYRDHNGTGA